MLSAFRLILCCVAVVCVLSSAGCSHVKPYEREYLTRPGMDHTREEMAEEFEAHAHEAREGAVGSSSSPGGGCGCN